CPQLAHAIRAVAVRVWRRVWAEAAVARAVRDPAPRQTAVVEERAERPSYVPRSVQPRRVARVSRRAAAALHTDAAAGVSPLPDVGDSVEFRRLSRPRVR